MKINKTTFGKPCFRALYGSQNYRLNSENSDGGEYKDFFDIAPSTFERIKGVKNGLVKPTDEELNGWRKIEEKIPENFPFNLEELLMSYEESILFE